MRKDQFVLYRKHVEDGGEVRNRRNETAHAHNAREPLNKSESPRPERWGSVVRIRRGSRLTGVAAVILLGSMSMKSR